LQENKRVAQSLDVEKGWQRAVETVLGDYLQAVCVDDAAKATADLAKLHDGKATLLVSDASVAAGEAGAGSLAARVRRAPPAVYEILRSVRVADSIQSALVVRDQIGPDGSVITQDGIWISQDWLRVTRDKDAQSGILGREHDMRRLRAEIRELDARYQSAKSLARDGRSRLHQLEQQREATQQDAAALLREYSETKAALDSARFQLEQANARQVAIAEESSDIEQEKFTAEEQVRASRRQFDEANDRLSELDVQRDSLLARRDELREELERVRTQADQDRQNAQDIEIQFESRRSSKESAAQSLARMESQLSHFGRRQTEIREQLDTSEAPLEKNKQDLETRLALRIEIEDELAAARRQVEEVDSELRDLDQSRMRFDRDVEENRALVSDAKMALQEIKVRREGIAEQFESTSFDLSTLLEELDEGAEIDGWEEKLDKIRRRIDRLGPINLAAIDEFKEQSERKEYLDSQLADLNDALATLEGAIRKIDKETRTRFRETFNDVDAGLKRLFPKLFGGGQAYLELTGDDLLTAGVTVMARPPGKRNSTIHLLSGGEKALTAVALVFAIFELNPAPFCLLDEVDAPLDDANVARYCDIVKDMADRVQFVFITHNKVTMEMARQLTGVTMQEPGVSRLVAVDLDEAVKMAAI
jgi:chromosome segregation protein